MIGDDADHVGTYSERRYSEESLWQPDNPTLPVYVGLNQPDEGLSVSLAKSTTLEILKRKSLVPFKLDILPITKQIQPPFRFLKRSPIRFIIERHEGGIGMAANQLLEWEKIASSDMGVFRRKEATMRARVPGGWLIRHKEFGGEGKSGAAMVYIEDKNGQWELDEESQWEIIYNRRSPNDTQIDFHLKVPGGWLIREYYYVKCVRLQSLWDKRTGFLKDTYSKDAGLNNLFV